MYYGAARLLTLSSAEELQAPSRWVGPLRKVAGRRESRAGTPVSACRQKELHGFNGGTSVLFVCVFGKGVKVTAGPEIQSGRQAHGGQEVHPQEA